MWTNQQINKSMKLIKDLGDPQFWAIMILSDF